MRSLVRSLAIAGGSLVGVVGVLLVATGYFALVGIPLVALAVLLLTFSFMEFARPDEQFDVVPAPSRPVVVSVVSVRGVCPRGYQLGNTWQIGDTGKVTPPICHPAIVALKSLLDGQPGVGEKPVVCRCPLGGYPVAFAVTASNGKPGTTSDLRYLGGRSVA